MSELLDQIEARHAEISKHAGLGKSQRRMLDAMFESVKDVPSLLAAVRAVEEAISDIETQARFRSDWEDGRAALADEIRHALTEALEGER